MNNSYSISPEQLKDQSAVVSCPNCQLLAPTRIEYKAGEHFSKDVEHHCARCNFKIAFWRRGSDLAQVMPSYPIAGQQQPTQITSAINYQTPQASANFFQPQLQHTVSHSTYQSVPHQHHFTQQAMSQQPVERDKMLQQPLSHPEMSHYSMDHVLQHVNPPGRTVEQLQQHRPRSQSPVAYPTPSHYNGSNGFTPSIAQQLKNVSHYATTPTADVSRPFSSMSSTLGSELHSPQIAGTSPPPSKW